MGSWGAITWDVARAGGFTAYGLLTLSVAVGLALTLQWQSARWPRLINSELHNFLTLLSLIFAAIHVGAVWIDPFTRFGWREVLVPLTSHYRPLWIALGIVGLYLALMIGLSTWMRPLIGYAWWRRLHVLTLIVFGLVTVHAVATGSDTRTWWGVGIYGASALLVGALLTYRLLVPVTERGHAHPVLAGLTAAATLVGIVWALLGPLQSGWNAVANNGQGSGGRGDTILQAAGALAQPAQPPSDPFAAAFQSNATGTLSRSGPDVAGMVTLDFHVTLTGGTLGDLEIQLRGQQASNGEGDAGQATAISITSTMVVLGDSTGAPLYQGQVTRLSQQDTWRMTAHLRGSGGKQLQVHIVWSVSDSGQVAGTVSGAPLSS